jgi:DNA polymerase-3 subunit alpha
MPNTDVSILSEAILNTRKIANTVEEYPFDTSLKFPIFEAGGLSQEDFLAKAAWEGLKRKGLDTNPIYVTRLKFELNTVTKLGFSSYFNVVSDIVNEAKKHQPVGVGRGSGSGSILGYCLGITNVDPIEFQLYFERFLSADRGIIAPTFGLGNEIEKITLDYTKLMLETEHTHDSNCIC